MRGRGLFLGALSQILIYTEVEAFPLIAANLALDILRSGKINGVAVLVINNE
jgi:propanol-preferring alcohol dehydrogenase